MSIGGHLAVVAIMVTSFAVLVDMGLRLVAPDRIQIMEIDLNDVNVTGDETRLYNTNIDNTPAPQPETEIVPPPAAREEKTVPEPVLSPVEIEKPTLVEDVAEEKPKEDKKIEGRSKIEDKKKEEVPPAPVPAAPKKRTVVRVNRDVLSLERTLTISVVDALRVAMTRCWNIDTSRSDIADIRAVAHLKMRKNGTVQDVWFESVARADTDPAFAYVLDTIRSAINVCQPFKMLPPGEYAKWMDIQLTFYPNQGKVM